MKIYFILINFFFRISCRKFSTLIQFQDHSFLFFFNLNHFFMDAIFLFTVKAKAYIDFIIVSASCGTTLIGRSTPVVWPRFGCTFEGKDSWDLIGARGKESKRKAVVALLLFATGCWVKLLEGRPNPSLSAYRSKNVPVKVCDPEKHLFRFNAQAVNSSL